ncbi:formate--tetrahydrofolate ligase [Porphyromonas macacae]|uniref:formate--tetrahydrofolate ligase n=1 Tax=Porphyromonas macacae TaxID=28115 RepID=UPI0024ADEFAA|nr:formate--tetrahydrofolate ligase [Porphyromonas macacae]
MKSDIEIARGVSLKPIEEVAATIGIPEQALEHYGHHIAKVPLEQLKNKKQKGKLILVTAITPTKTGVGKTTVSVGLSLGLNRIGKKAIVALREPSLGPCFGMKGGAAGGGYAQVLPMENINLHFTGDFHAVTSAHNMITALLDNYMYQNRNNLQRNLSEVTWKRVLDVNDRSLRNVVSGLGGRVNGITCETGFDITPASEIMAILCLANDMDDLKRRIENIVLGYTVKGTPFTVKDLGVAGAITVLLKDAIKPNLVQTTENTPAFVHGGPFANIAHGANSVLATKMALTYGEYVVTEAGFGADLGAEKFFNIKSRMAGLNPDLTVLVVTVGGLKLNGGTREEDLKQPDVNGLRRGLKNLDRHVANLQKFGQTVVVAFNRFASDTSQEISVVADHCKELGIGFAINNAFAEGGEGAEVLAHLVVDTIEENPSKPLKFTYDLNDSIEVKANKVAKEIYDAGCVTFTTGAKKKLKDIEAMGLSHLPICIAKTQYSFTQDPKAVGDLHGFELEVSDVVINAGAEMIVLIMGSIMRMPGLPKHPSALGIDIVDGQIEGLS